MYNMNGHELRRAREAMGFTQRELAERLGMTSTSVARMERGEQRILLVTELAVRYVALMQKPKRRTRR
ncbi:MAG: helix-turn-helix transcriptional regulator [Deltaproteobacteria bacterium]|nr:helix-turn-helix transcriptional regulator [Deltaproteobacteria bacterium]